MNFEDEASYVCPSCGEEILVPVDPAGGHQQEYVEDCPVCCCPVELRVQFHEDGTCQIEARAE
jgi:DNA replicative helicase MCM subunit Mcm2 (Cdc46/Mcm family)